MAGLTWQLESRGAVPVVRFAGDISQDLDLGRLLSDLHAPEVVIDLAAITRITSTGVRTWIRFIAALEDRGTRVALDRCAVPVVHQINFLGEQFVGGARVRSVMAPFYCGICNVEQHRVIDASRPITAQLAPPESCRRCGRLMDFDELLDHYDRLTLR